MTVEKILTGTFFGKDNRLEVLEKSGRKSGKTPYYYVRCRECAKDPEMYPGGLFETTRSQIRYGIMPCGCVKNSRLSERQWALRVSRALVGKNCEFQGFVGDFIGEKSRSKFRCLIDGHEWETNVRGFCEGSGCSKCASKALEVPEETYYEKFKASGVFVEGTKFSKSGRRDKYGQNIWSVHCPVCAEDEYTKAGLCTGVFDGIALHLERGIMSCRCSPSCHRTLEQIDFQVRNECKKRDCEFVEWLVYDVPNKKDMIFILKCNICGNLTTHNVTSFLKSENGCEYCAEGGGFKKHLPGALYVLRTACNTFAGYGISNRIASRVATHRRELLRHQMEIADMVFFDTLGSIAAKIEREVKQEFPLNSQPITGFKTEATHAHLYDDVVAFVQSRLAAISESSKEDRCETLK